VSAADLARWIDSHARPEPTVNNEDGTLTVASYCIGPDGMRFIEHDTIPATMQAARDLLGY
jgi:hypothetical protein